ncbi:MAG: ABC transporter ATP-binding protein [Desulfitobacterium sp.]
MLRAENISYQKGAKFILKEINWSVRQGERWVIFGLNGSGKTSLLSILATYQSTTRGNLYIKDEKLTKENIIYLRQQIGFASSSFFDQYFVRENVLDIVLSGKSKGLGRTGDITPEDVREAKGILTEFGLKRKTQYPYDLLSRGQRQCVITARALIGNPDILILDEPCEGLDISARLSLLQRIEKIAMDKDKTIIYVTHHTDEILSFFEHALLLKDGKIHTSGEIKKIFTDENMTDFLGWESKICWNNGYLNISLH